MSESPKDVFIELFRKNLVKHHKGYATLNWEPGPKRESAVFDASELDKFVDQLRQGVDSTGPTNKDQAD